MKLDAWVIFLLDGVSEGASSSGESDDDSKIVGGTFQHSILSGIQAHSTPFKTSSKPAAQKQVNLNHQGKS